MELCLIWAQDRHGALGRGDPMPWQLPEHLQHLRETTAGAPLIVGRKSWPLPLRPPGAQVLVLTRSHDAQFEGAIRANTLTDALSMAGVSHPAQTFIIGGVTLFELALTVAQRVYVTEVDIALAQPGAPAPDLPAARWLAKESQVLRAESGLQYRFVEYRLRTTRP